MNEKCERPTMAQDLSERFNEVASRAHALAQQTAGKLEPIMRPTGPCDNAKCSTAEQQYPPLLAEYRSKLYEIENALDSIAECLDRVEV